MVITKQSINDDHIHHLQLNANQSSVPIHFTIKDTIENKNSSVYLLSLLAFDESNQSSRESLLFQQYFPVNHVNSTTFIVHNTCRVTFRYYYFSLVLFYLTICIANLLKCLPADYPCLDTSEMSDKTVSVCCNDIKCQHSDKNKLNKPTCGGRAAGKIYYLKL
ncbi:unnamed protein product [Rotaria sp. Silwood2]|nr:unnamed protein product [Rotaria sp. Silwood2]